MAYFKSIRDPKTGEEALEVSLRGQHLLDTPLLNKGSAFSEAERDEFGLLGLLPSHVSTIEEQVTRIYENYQYKQSDLEKYIFLTALQDRNETLFYRFLQEHITEVMPIIYTPVVGSASKHYSHIYRKPRGLYIAFPHLDDIDKILDNSPTFNPKVIVVTDGERILGLGDLGIGGMGIPIGKLSLYTLCAGINPATTLPIILDVGTDNQKLLHDPLYLGWRHERIRGQAYDDFIEVFVNAVVCKFPNVLLQWEDFAKDNAARLRDRYCDRLCTFNDDIQGTGAVTLAGILTVVDLLNAKLKEQRIVLLGAGSAAQGICEQIVSAMMAEGASLQDAKANIFLVDSVGLVHTQRKHHEPFKQKFAQPFEAFSNWKASDSGQISLSEVVEGIAPSILIGVAAQPNSFTEEIVRTMAKRAEHPIIFPLSNPTSKSEAVPADLVRWTEGRAWIATGSPFAPVQYGGRTIQIGQCNNAYIFPGMGLGILASKAKRVTDAMFVAAARALSKLSPARKNMSDPLYPPLETIREVSKQVAFAVGCEAQKAGLAPKTSKQELMRRVEAKMWRPQYLSMRCHSKRKPQI